MKELAQGSWINDLHYKRSGNYHIPELIIPKENRPIGHWGRLYRQYFKENHPIQYDELVVTGRLWSCLADMDEQAQERLELIIGQMKQSEGVTEELKEHNQMEWTRRMNSIRNRAEEIVLTELIYV